MEFTKITCVLNEMCVLLRAEVRLQSTSPWFRLEPQAVFCWWSGWEPMCQSESCSCICICALMRWWDLLAWYVLQMEKLNTARSYLHFFLDTTPQCMAAFLLGQAWCLAGSVQSQGCLWTQVSWKVFLLTAVFSDKSVMPKYREGRRMCLRLAKSLLGRAILRWKYCPWKLWSGVCCA